MKQKTISLNTKAYTTLRRFKQAKESFSDLVIRLCNEQDRSNSEDILLRYAGIFKDSAGEWARAQEQIEKSRNAHMIDEE